MRLLPTLLALLLAGCAAAGTDVPGATQRPMRVMSMNLCTDQLVLALLPPERTASVTWLSRLPGQSLLVEEASQVGVNYALAEEVIDQRPDLVLAGKFTNPAL
ncbi:MAG: ABC transporter substrate-binding protein, partial [Pseudomonadota bacterium]